MQRDFNEIIRAFAGIYETTLFNLYTCENIIFNRLKLADKVPYEKYIEDLGIQKIANRELEFDGDYIENGCVKEVDFNHCCFDYYREKIEYIFCDYPTVKGYENDDDLEHYKNGLYEYLKDLYNLFAEIIKTEVEPDFFATVPDILDKSELAKYFAKTTKFVTAIKVKHLRQGSRIDRYVKELPLLSPFVNRLVKKNKGHFLLANSDTNSLDYKFALLSCIRFYSEKNAKLFELKTLKWENLNK